MKNLLKKSMSGILAASVILGSMSAVFATGDGTKSQYPGEAEYETSINDKFVNDKREAINPSYIDSVSGAYAPLVSETPKENLFTVGGKEFILLDTDSAGNYFIMVNSLPTDNSDKLSYFGDNYSIDNNTYSARRFDATNPKSVAYTINSKIGTYFPTAIQNKMINTTWYLEANDADKPGTVYSTTCKVALPSYTELITYKSKIGWNGLDSLFYGMQTRTTIKNAASVTNSSTGVTLTNQYVPAVVGKYTAEKNVKWIGTSNPKNFLQVRPVCFVDKDFFRDVAVDTTATLGENVKKEILEYSAKELLGAYTKEQLKTLGFGAEVDRLIASTYPGTDYYKDVPKLLSSGNPIGGGNGVFDQNKTAAITTETPSKYKFKVGDTELIYVDTDKDGNMIAMLENVVTEKNGYCYYDATTDGTNAPTGEQKYFNVNNPWSVAYKINTDEFINKYIPIKGSNNLVDTDWYVETNEANPVYTTCKIALPSATEVGFYGQRIGSWTKSTVGNALTRSAFYDSTKKEFNGGISITYNSGASIPRVQYNQYGAYQGATVRPMFVISKVYFEENKLNVTDMGDDVKSYFLGTFTKSELKDGTVGYNDNELTAIGYAGAPSASNLTIDGASYSVGAALTGNYTFLADSTGAAEDTSKIKYQWFVSDTANGTYTEIAGATAATFVPTDAQKDKYLKFGVKTGNIDDISAVYAMSDATPKIGDRVEYTVNVAWKDSSNNTVTTVNGATSLKACFTVNNLTDAASNKALIIAVYDAENGMQAVRVIPTQEIKAGSGTYEISVDGFTGKAGWSVKAMLWSDMEKIMPIYCETLE